MPSKKKRQHYVPKVYLQPFTDSTPPEGWPPNTPYTPAVWTLDPRSLGSAQRRSPSNILWENSLYTLASDDPSAPAIEEGLSRLEKAYAGVRDAILRRDSLNAHDYSTLVLFIGALYGRVPPQMEHWQQFMDKLHHISRQMSDLPPVGMSWEDFEETGKKSVVMRASAYAEVIAKDGFILVNETEMPFIASDKPVTHAFVHIDEAPLKHFESVMRAQVTPNVEAFFSFVPLAPDTAFVASPLLSHGGTLYHLAPSLDVVFSLNQYTRNRARTIVSKTPRPYGTFTEAVIAKEAELQASAQSKSGLMLYTPTARVWVSCQQVIHEMGAHPLHGVIRFVADDASDLHEFRGAQEIVEVRIYSEGMQTGGMRNAWLSAVAIDNDAESVIQTWPGGWPSWRDRADSETN